MVLLMAVEIEHCVTQRRVKEIVIDDRFTDPGLSGVIDDLERNKHSFEESEFAELGAQARRLVTHRKPAERFNDPKGELVHEHVHAVSHPVRAPEDADSCAVPGFASLVPNAK